MPDEIPPMYYMLRRIDIVLNWHNVFGSLDGEWIQYLSRDVCHMLDDGVCLLQQNCMADVVLYFLKSDHFFKKF